MGVTITATNSTCDFDMGYSGFFNLRRNIALALDDEFGQAYSEYGKCFTKEDFKRIDHLVESLINEKHLDDEYFDVLDFLFMPDGSGKISYKTCRKIANLLEPCMSALRTKTFRYAAYAGHDYEDFVAFLRDCVRHRRNMRWW